MITFEGNEENENLSFLWNSFVGEENVKLVLGTFACKDMEDVEVEAMGALLVNWAPIDGYSNIFWLRTSGPRNQVGKIRLTTES